MTSQEDGQDNAWAGDPTSHRPWERFQQKPHRLPRAAAPFPFWPITFRLRHSWTRARMGAGALRCDHLKGCLSTSSLWSRSPHTQQGGTFTSLSFSLFFLINNLELPGAVGCCRADKSHFRPVLALKGGRRDECVLGAQSLPLPATWGLAAPVAESPGTVPSHWPQLPLRVLAAEARMGREEKRSYRRGKGRGEEEEGDPSSPAQAVKPLPSHF